MIFCVVCRLCPGYQSFYSNFYLKLALQHILNTYYFSYRKKFLLKDCEQRSYRKPSSLHRRLSFKSSRSSLLLLLLRVAFKHFNSLFLQWETNLCLEIKSEKAKNSARCCDRDRAAKNRTHKTGRSRCWPFKEVSLQRVGEPRFLIRLWWV